MAEGEQDEVIAFLSRGSSYGASGEAPRRVDTHISHVFLTRDRVFKLKRAVRFSFVDATSLAAPQRYTLLCGRSPGARTARSNGMGRDRRSTSSSRCGASTTRTCSTGWRARAGSTALSW